MLVKEDRIEVDTGISVSNPAIASLDRPSWPYPNPCKILEVLASKYLISKCAKPGSSPIKGIRKRPLWVYVLKTTIKGKGLVVS